MLVIVGGFLRLFNLHNVPPGLNFDETLYGLDSYNILKTGRDMYGHFMPLAFQSSGYYPPLYTYILVPFLAVFGVSSEVVRLPSAIAGIVSIVIIYLFTKKLFPDRKGFVPIISAFLLTLLPWHIHISRVSFLAGFGIIFVLLGLYLFLKAKKTMFYLDLSAISLALSVFVHYGYVFFSPIMFTILIILFWKKYNLSLKNLYLPGVIWFITFSLLLIAYSKYNMAFRINEFSGKSIFTITGHYLKTFSPQFLFVSGDDYRLANPWGEGQLPVLLFPFIVLGLIRLRRFQYQTKILLIALLLLIPIPSAIAGLGKNAVRNSPLIIPLIIFASIGIEPFINFRGLKGLGILPSSLHEQAHTSKLLGSMYSLARFHPSSQTRWCILRANIKKFATNFTVKVLTIFTALIFLTGIFSSLRYYFSDYSKEYSYLWGNPKRQVVDYILKNKERFGHIFITDTYNLMLSYYSFETRLLPEEIQTAILKPSAFDGLPTKKIDNVYFIATEELKEENFYRDVPKGSLIVDPIFYIDNSEFKVVKYMNRDSFQYLRI